MIILQLDGFPSPVPHAASQRIAPTHCKWQRRFRFRMGKPGARGEAERVITARAVKEGNE